MTNSHSITLQAHFSSSSSSGNSIQKSFRRDNSLDSTDLQASVTDIATSLNHSDYQVAISSENSISFFSIEK
jgi:hypothetical protein